MPSFHRPPSGLPSWLAAGMAISMLALPAEAQTPTATPEPASSPALPPAAPALSASLAAGSAPQLPEIKVRQTRAPIDLQVDRPVTTINAVELQRRQSENIFDVLKDVPGLSVAGGPRASGMKFNLRGFSDNEDVLFKIDGAVKGFEKYRFGGGVFIEPELLKAIEVERGPSVTSGSGALGGTISATTRSAADFLKPGERIGAMTKLGYNWNNRERLRMVSVFGRPSAQFDLLASVSRRDSGDLRMPDGERLGVSATHSESSLLKLGWFPTEALSIELSRVAYASGPERAPYDATHGSATGVGGIVRREIDDETVNLRFTYAPDNPWIKLRGLLAKERTHLHDEHVRGESAICVTPATLPLPAAFVTARCTDQWQYDIATHELFNDSSYRWHTRWGDVNGQLTLGLQDIRNERDVVRVADNDRFNQYPGGFNSAQPPGDKHSTAFIIENSLKWQNITFVPGARVDRYQVRAQGGTQALMEAAGQDASISFRKVSRSAALTWQPNASDWRLTYRYNETFRPPLIDEYFAASGFGSRCARTEINPYDGQPYSPPGQPLYDATGGVDLAPLNGICGDLYKPQEAVNREITVAWSPRTGPFDGLSARLTAFRMNVSGLLQTLRAMDGKILQTGTETRRGTELEANYHARRWFASLAHSRTEGRVRDTGVSPASLVQYGIPGPSTVFSIGGRWMEGRLEAGWRFRSIGDRKALVGAASECNSTGVRINATEMVGTHYGVKLQELFASWQVTERALLRLSVDNLTNETYCLNDSFAGAVGAVAAGRSARMSVAVQF